MALGGNPLVVIRHATNTLLCTCLSLATWTPSRFPRPSNCAARKDATGGGTGRRPSSERPSGLRETASQLARLPTARRHLAGETTGGKPNTPGRRLLGLTPVHVRFLPSPTLLGASRESADDCRAYQIGKSRGKPSYASVSPPTACSQGPPRTSVTRRRVW